MSKQEESVRICFLSLSLLLCILFYHLCSLFFLSRCLFFTSIFAFHVWFNFRPAFAALTLTQRTHQGPNLGLLQSILKTNRFWVSSICLHHLYKSNIIPMQHMSAVHSISFLLLSVSLFFLFQRRADMLFAEDRSLGCKTSAIIRHTGETERKKESLRHPGVLSELPEGCLTRSDVWITRFVMLEHKLLF